MGKLGIKFFLSLLAIFTVFFGISAGHSLAATAMHGMSQKMTANQCQSSCTPQSQLVGQNNKSELDNKDIEPQPAEPYQAFISVGWTTVVAIAVAYLLGYLRWRPPDLFKLHVNYRF